LLSLDNTGLTTLEASLFGRFWETICTSTGSRDGWLRSAVVTDFEKYNAIAQGVSGRGWFVSGEMIGSRLISLGLFSDIASENECAVRLGVVLALISLGNPDPLLCRLTSSFGMHVISGLLVLVNQLINLII